MPCPCAVRQSVGAARRTRPPRSGCHLLARIRQGGKEDIPVLFLLSHQAGLPAIVGTLIPEEGTSERTPSNFSSTLLARALNVGGAFSDPEWANRREWHAAKVPAANGITNAASLSRLYAGLTGTLEGGPAEPILTKAQVDEAQIVRTFGADQVFSSLGFPMEQHIGQGFRISNPFAHFGGGGSFGHAGAGGSYGFADPESNLAVGYVMNQMSTGMTGDARARRLIKACYQSVGATPKYF